MSRFDPLDDFERVELRLEDTTRDVFRQGQGPAVVVIAEVPEALSVPSVAIVPELGGKMVYVVEDGVAVSRPVETGIRTESDVEVTSGLPPGDRVIVTGLERVKAFSWEASIQRIHEVYMDVAAMRSSPL